MQHVAISGEPSIFRAVAIPSNVPLLHSRLYHLEPCGIDTPYVESLTSYITRLAKTHSVSSGQLFTREIVPLVNKPYLLTLDKNGKSNPLTTFRLALRCLNGIGDVTTDFIRALEMLTLRPSLHLLTMLTWSNVIGEQFLLRDFRAWCSACYEEWQNDDATVYDPLIWHLNIVEVCLRHKQDLVVQCCQCNSQLPIFSHSSRIGVCSRCAQWLGISRNIETRNRSRYSDDEFAYRMWVANQMGMLIAAATPIINIPQRKTILEAVSLCIDNIAPQNLEAFAQLFSTSKTVVSHWRSGKNVPRIDFLFKICFKLRVNVLDFILKPNEIFNSTNEHAYWKSVVVDRTKNQLRKVHKQKALLDALNENSPPHLREVAKRVGLVSHYQLQTECPELYEKVKNRYESSVQFHDVLPKSKIRKVDDATLKNALNKALKEMPPPSIEAFARRQGYTGSSTIRQRFPHLVRSLQSKRKYYFSTIKRNICRKLKEILSMSIPISMAETCKRLGFKNESTLRAYAPELCREISARFIKYRKRKWETIRKFLLSMLKKYPPPSIKEVIKNVNASRGTLYHYFPDLCHGISARHKQHRNELVSIKRQQLQAEVIRVVSELHAQNICPSEKRVRKLLSIPICLGNREFYWLYGEIRKQVESGRQA